ncbi:MAG: ATP-binding protein, partial [bacterium]|nr:ATP-binding protein [bacterium]
MDITNEVVEIIGQPESSKLEYKSVLPPSRNIAQLISSFANADGGYIILGVSDSLEINGLSE